jgi:hypothetical protein
VVLQSNANAWEPWPTKRFSFAVYGAISTSMVVFRHLIAALQSDQLFGTSKDVDSNLKRIQLLAAIVLQLSFISIPRRPDVFYNGNSVDRQFAISIFDRYSFSWATPVRRLAMTRHLKISDLPSVDNSMRSRTLCKEYEKRKGHGRLWMQLVKTYRWTCIHQWSLIFFKSTLGSVVQISLHRFLQTLETVSVNGPGSKEEWVWVLLFSFGLTAEVIVSTWLKWVTEMRLEMRTTALLAAVIFQKTTRRKIIERSQESIPRSSPNIGDQENQTTRQSETNLIRADA